MMISSSDCGSIKVFKGRSLLLPRESVPRESQNWPKCQLCCTTRRKLATRMPESFPREAKWMAKLDSGQVDRVVQRAPRWKWCLSSVCRSMEWWNYENEATVWYTRIGRSVGGLLLFARRPWKKIGWKSAVNHGSQNINLGKRRGVMKIWYKLVDRDKFPAVVSIVQ